MRFGVPFCVLILCSSGAFAGVLDDTRPTFGSHYGYTFNIKEEKNKRDIEMVMLDKPEEPATEATEPMVNERLSKEFQEQYRYRFGQTQAEQVINSPGRSEEYTVYTGQNVTLQDYQFHQRQFAEYMGRRLTEYHVDNWAKNDRDFKKVYELKDRVSNLNVEVKKGYKLNWRYNFAGPTMDAKIENPYDVEIKVRAEMSGIISKPVETIYSVGYPLTSRVNVQTLYREVDKLVQLVFTRRMTRQISTSLTGMVDSSAAGATVQQNLILVGFSWSE